MTVLVLLSVCTATGIVLLFGTGIVISRLSGTIIHGFSDVPPKMLTLRPFELQCISINEDSLFLPRYIDAEEKMHFHKMPTIEDALNIITYYVE